MPPERRNAKNGVCRTIAAIAAALNDFEEETFAIGRAIELEIFAVIVSIVENIMCLQTIGEGRLQAESRLEIVVILGRDHQRRKTIFR